jgi:Tat-translocated enzyme
MTEADAAPAGLPDPDAESAGPSVEADGEKRGLSRRGLFGWGGGLGVAAGAVVGGFGGAALAPKAAGGHLEYSFFGEHQAGIVTPAQDRLHFAAFDLRADAGRAEVIALLQDWTYAASRLTLGLDVSARGAFDGGPYLPPDDTGEAAGLDPSGLTITFGFGPTLFRAADGTDRYGLAGQLPADFTPLPKMANDFISLDRSGGDLCVQACANDPQVAVHAIRNLTRIAFGRATLRWSQLGFGRTSSTSSAQTTPRNLFGQKDGTRNLKAEQPERLAEHVWISDGPSWAHGGSYLVARRIAMTIEVWDGLQLSEQDRVLGRDKKSGAPLSGGTEFSEPDFTKAGASGGPLIDPRSHVARTAPENNGGIAMLRRGYNYVDGNDDTGRLDAGLFFIGFVKAPERFAKVHTNMARDDMFSEYLKTTSSSVFLVPPGVRDGQYVGHTLFEA